MSRLDPAGWVRRVAARRRDRDVRRAELLERVLDARGDSARGDSVRGDSARGDDDEVVVAPWRIGLPRTVIVAAARHRGLVPVGGTAALARRGPWLEPLRFTRPAGRSAS